MQHSVENKDGKRIVRDRFDSLSDLADTCKKKAPAAWKTPASVATDGMHGSERWDLGVRLGAACNMARVGWPEGGRKVSILAGAVLDKITSRIQVEDWAISDEGHFFDVSRVLTGEPECWLTPVPMEVDGHSNRGVVALAISTTASSHVTAGAMMARGTVIAALIQALEYAGRPCEVRADFCARERDTIYSGSVLIKRAGEPLDMARLAFALIHPTFSRRLGFAAIERCKVNLFSLFGSGYGSPCTSPDPSDIEFPAMRGYGDSDFSPSPEEWILNKLREQGVKLND